MTSGELDESDTSVGNTAEYHPRSIRVVPRKGKYCAMLIGKQEHKGDEAMNTTEMRDVLHAEVKSRTWGGRCGCDDCKRRLQAVELLDAVLASHADLLRNLRIGQSAVCSNNCPSTKHGDAEWTHCAECESISAAYAAAEKLEAGESAKPYQSLRKRLRAQGVPEDQLDAAVAKAATLEAGR